MGICAGSYKIFIFSLVVIFITFLFWFRSDEEFQQDSEELALSMVVAGMHNFDIGNRIFGLGWMQSSEGNALYVYSKPELYENSITERPQQIGIQGWAFYYLAKLGIPRPLSALRLGCCLALALVLSLISYEIMIRYGKLFAAVFLIVSASSLWLANFAPNLYWVTFTWFIPMLLGLICINNLEKRKWIYPLVFLAIFIKAACGYEYITVVMSNSIVFLFAEWLYAINRDKEQAKLLFRTVFMFSLMAMLGFTFAFLINAYMRGAGDIKSGISAIYENDVLRRTFGDAANFDYPALQEALNASIMDVIIIYLTKTVTGIIALAVVIATMAIFIYERALRKTPVSLEFLLTSIAFFCCISWFVLGKSHSYNHTHMAYVMWYMGFIQIGSYNILNWIIKKEPIALCLKNLSITK